MRIVLAAVLAFVLGSVALSGETIPNRMERAQVGEWLLMEDVSGAEDGERTKFTVIGVGDGTVTIRREHLDGNGDVTESKEHEIDLKRYNDRMESIKGRATAVTREFVVIKDEEYEVVAVEFISESKTEDGEDREVKLWLSDDLPVSGLAKVWSSDANIPSAEVIDFGF